jgi:NADPH:quinone reductase-like Zn-dependent oxidoreductase
MPMTTHFNIDAQAPSRSPFMKAARVRRFGGPEAITLESMDRPVPGEGEVLVRVKAAGVGPWDAWVRAGKSVLPQPLPLTLGADLSGVIAEVGPSVSAFKIRDAVFGVTNPQFTGAYAEYAIASAGMIAPKPTRIADVDAAAAPVVAVTAWQGLFEEAKLVHGDSVLIHGTGGGVGSFAVQIARRAGLRIVATAGARDLAYVRSLGADEVVDYQAARFEDAAQGMDAVLDCVGGQTQTRSFAVLRRGGRLVSIVANPDPMLAERHGVNAKFFLVDVTTERLNRIVELLEKGVLFVEIGAVLPLASARLAHAMLAGERPRPRGKIVLRIVHEKGPEYGRVLS